MDSTRRDFMLTTAGAATAVAMGWRALGLPQAALAAAPSYGPLGPPDINGVRLPPGFSAKLIAKTGQVVPGTSYVWPQEPDGAATFATNDGGWVLACNSEANGNGGGVSAIRFDSAGRVTDAYRILSGTKWNCAGGKTPWGTWLSCEEYRSGQVWECDPFQPGQGIPRPALGLRCHEAAPVHEGTGYVYMTEDHYGGRLYRFIPDTPEDLSSGQLQAASVGAGGAVTWVNCSPKAPYRGRDTTVFDRGEGAWIDKDVLYFSTTEEDRVWALDLAAMTIRVIYDGKGPNAADALHSPDNITVDTLTGSAFVAEDGDDVQLVRLTPNGATWVPEAFIEFAGHVSSEVTGPTFSPDGSRMYVNSQRGTDKQRGMTFEITGPWR